MTKTSGISTMPRPFLRISMWFFFLVLEPHVFLFFVFCFLIITLLSSSTRRRFHPQRSSGQAVVTGVVPSPRYVPSIFIAHRVQHSHCSSIFIECWKLTLSRFPLIIFLSKKKSLRVCALGENWLILVGTTITYQAAGDATTISSILFCLTLMLQYTYF